MIEMLGYWLTFTVIGTASLGLPILTAIDRSR